MRIAFFKTLWGWKGTWQEALAQAVEAGFAGIEGPLPREPAACEEAAASLAESGLAWIAEISTTGYAAPEAGAPPSQHLAVLRQEMERALPLRPLLITSMAGDDCWTPRESIRFLREAMRVAEDYGVTLCCETHRARSLFHPLVTMEILARVPELRITADFSHWCNVCERLVLDEYPQFLEACAPHVHHIHARIGHEQGAQVADPRLPLYRMALEAHLRWWKVIWNCRQAAGARQLTITPEFGPDGYQPVLPSTGEPWGDLWELNRSMAEILRHSFPSSE